MYGLSYVFASIKSFFTHNLLFLLLNLMIATIAFVSAFTNKMKQQDIAGISIDSSAEESRVRPQAPYLFDENPPRTEAQFARDSSAGHFHDALDEIIKEEKQVLCVDNTHSKLPVSHPSTSESGYVAATTRKPVDSSHFEDKEVVEERQTATPREVVIATATDGDEEVDAKADDFINRFKQQLKLQMLDPINRGWGLGEDNVI